MAFKKGDEKPLNSGRKKGVKNKLTIDVQQTAFDIFKNLGGVKGATEYFESNKQTRGQFYNIFYKMLPTSLVGEQDDKGEFKPLKVIVSKDGNKPDNPT